VNKYESILLLMNNGEIYPVSTMAFEVSQSSKKQLLKNIDALAIYRNGDVLKVREINRVSLYGKTFFSKLLSALVGAYDINVSFDKLDFKFDELKAKVNDSLVADSLSDDPIFDHLVGDIEIISKKILLADTAENLFDVISVPFPEDCLDML